MPVVPGPHRAGHGRRRRSPPPRSRSASRCCSSPAPAAAARACGWCAREAELPDAIAGRPPRGPRLLRRRHPAGRALHRRRPGTSRCRCSATPTAPSIHLGERECSLQRRHQKVIEEAPSPLLDTARRARHGRAPRSRPRRAVGYTGAGTVEFIVDADRPRRVLLPRDEHPAAGRAPGHRVRHRPGPGRAAGARRGRRAAAVRPGRRRRSTGTPSRPGSTPRTRRAASCRRPAPCSGWSSRPAPGVRVDSSLRRRQRRRHRLRPDAGQGDRLGARPGDRAGPAGRRARAAPPSSGWRPTPRSCGRCSPTPTSSPAGSTPG